MALLRVNSKLAATVMMKYRHFWLMFSVFSYKIIIVYFDLHGTTLQFWSENETCFTKRIDVNLVIRFRTLSLSFILSNGWLRNQSTWAVRNVAASSIRNQTATTKNRRKCNRKMLYTTNSWGCCCCRNFDDSCVNNKSRTTRQPIDSNSDSEWIRFLRQETRHVQEKFKKKSCIDNN